MDDLEGRAYIPPTAHQRNSHSDCWDEDNQDRDADPPAAADSLPGSGNNNHNTKSTRGIRTSEPTSRQDVDYHAFTSEPSTPQHPHRRHLQTGAITTASSDIHPDHDDSETQQASVLAAASLHANLPAWAVAALQETLEQPWKIHFDGSDDRAGDPDFATGSDPVPFYDGRLKVCYGEGSMAA